MTGSQLLNAVLQQGLQLFVLVGFVYAVNVTFARRRPKLAYALWMLVFVKAITPPIGAAGFSAWNLLSTATGQSSLAIASDAGEESQMTALLPGISSASVTAADSSAVLKSVPSFGVSFPASLAVVWAIGTLGLAFLSGTCVSANVSPHCGNGRRTERWPDSAR